MKRYIDEQIDEAQDNARYIQSRIDEYKDELNKNGLEINLLQNIKKAQKDSIYSDIKFTEIGKYEGHKVYEYNTETKHGELIIPHSIFSDYAKEYANEYIDEDFVKKYFNYDSFEEDFLQKFDYAEYEGNKYYVRIN